MIITIMIIRIAMMMITVDLQDQKSLQHESSCDLCFHLIV
jgi:hypothetical protein